MTAKWWLWFIVGGAACASSAAPPATSTRAPLAADRAIATWPPLAPISPEEFARRRAALRGMMQDGVLIAFGSPAPWADYLTFAQNSPFRYLTGLVEPDAVLVIAKSGGETRDLLFVPQRNPAREVWEGSRLGAEGAQRLTGIPTRPTGALLPVLDSLLADARILYTLDTGGSDSTRAERDLARLAAGRAGLRVAPADEWVQRLRGIRSAAELDRIRRAVAITDLAHREAMRTIEPGMNEFEIQALIEYTFRRHGAERPGFASIVGSGPNATTLHYNANNRFMQATDMVVMDIGASYGGYTADVTRTVPVDGTFSAEQRAVYDIVLAAQKAAESVVRQGATWQQLDGAANQVLAAGLARLGLIDAANATYTCGNAQGRNCPQHRMFYMHGLGHGIGLDVHDPDASYFGGFRIGSAFTLEPGIYIRADAFDHLPDTPENRAMAARLRPALERFRNIGVRIEDDYLITTTGVERLSTGAPREPGEIEALMAEPGLGNVGRRPEIVEWYRGLSTH